MTGAVPLATQLNAPEPPGVFVERPRLLDRLDGGPPDQIALICAPLGSGKTSLAASWAATVEHSAWLSLSAEDDHPLRFWPAFLAALKEADPDAPVSALAPPEAGADLRFLALVVNALAAAPRPHCLVVDDVHVLRSAACRRQLGFVVAHLPRTVRLVLSTRAELRLPLHHARLSGRLCELGPRELAFTRGETAQLLAAHGLELEPPLVAALHERTEGWAAGLRLAALSLRETGDREQLVREFAGDDRAVAEYLLAEVLDAQPVRRRRFLLRTAIVERVSGDLADALTEGSTGHDTLSELRRTNGFVIPLDRREHWYRYQALFGDLLRSRAEQELGDELPVLRARAARWYLRAGEPREALHHALAAADWELAGELLRAHWFELRARTGPADVHALFARMPDACVAADATLSEALGYLERELGGEPAARPQAGVADARTRALVALQQARSPDEVDDVAGRLRGAGGAIEAAIDLELGVAQMWIGELEPGARHLQRAIERALPDGLDHVAMLALGHLALVELWRAGPDAAEPAACQALELAQRHGGPEHAPAVPALLAAAACALSGVRPTQARERIAQARAAGARAGDPRLALVFDAMWDAIHSPAGEPAPLLAAGTPAEAAAVAARRALQSGDAADALDAIRDAGPAMDAAFSATRVQLAVLETLALDALGRTAAADEALERALAAAEQTGHRIMFLDGGPRMVAMLRQRIRAGTQHRALAGDLLSAFATGEVTKRERVALLEPLSDRELTVLRYLPTLLPTREIAAELFVSPNTVKSHLRSIYRKLGVQCRREAIDRARELRLLSWR